MYSSPATPTGTGCELRVEDVELRVGDRPADRERLAAGLDRARRSTRSSSRSGRTCSTARRRAPTSSSASSRGSASPPHSALRPGRPAPAGVEQHAPGRRRGLHHRGAAAARAASPSARGSRDVVAAGAMHDPRAGDQRQVQLQAGDVERQRRHRDEHVVRSPGPGARASTTRKLTSARCGISTPLGRPVEPEV